MSWTANLWLLHRIAGIDLRRSIKKQITDQRNFTLGQILDKTREDELSALKAGACLT